MVQEAEKLNLLHKMGNYREMVAAFHNNKSQLEESEAKWDENTCKVYAIQILSCYFFWKKNCVSL